jgi:hypothetical protein
MVTYLDENTIIASKITALPWKGRTVSGYGKDLPTTRMIQLANKRWYRVKAVCYSNAASFYITMKGFGNRYIDGFCEDRILEVQI